MAAALVVPDADSAQKAPPTQRKSALQSHALDFVGNTSWIQHGEDSAGRQAFATEQQSTDTVPAGSMWTRNPILDCIWSGAELPACSENPPTCTAPGCSTASSPGRQGMPDCISKLSTRCTPPLPDQIGGGYDGQTRILEWGYGLVE